jgi:hypothetical protein
MSRKDSLTGPRLAGFLALHLVLISAAVAWGVLRARERAGERELPTYRDEPLAVVPLYDDPEVIGDEQLRRVLSRLGLRPQGSEMRISHVDHALRLWGPEKRFDDPEVLSGEALRGLLTDHRQLVSMYGAEAAELAPLLIDDGIGVRVRFQEGYTSTSHLDHSLAALAEVGTPLDFPVVTDLRETTLRDVFEQSLRDFSLNQPEYEWSALAYALYLPPTNRWISSEGQEITFDRLARRIMREELESGVCSGSHRLHTLVVFLRVDDLMGEAGEPRILTAEGRERVLEHLRGVTARLVRHQHPDGFWNGRWPTAAPEGSEPSGGEGDRLADRLIVTGHTLEWWALAPREVHPPRSVVIAAAQWLVRTVEGMSQEEIEENFTYLSHVGRALALWRGVFAYEVDLEES